MICSLLAGGSVDRFLFVWASFRIHTGSWDV